MKITTTGGAPLQSLVYLSVLTVRKREENVGLAIAGLIATETFKGGVHKI